ncbi:MAG TPA: hypothetical protein VHQ00_03690 [Chloroflexota bacterium]|nr:hypothetical protein [Chloroflexota bacterium]
MGHPGPPDGVEGDDEQAASNAEKHGVTFEEAAVALTHPKT